MTPAEIRRALSQARARGESFELAWSRIMAAAPRRSRARSRPRASPDLEVDDLRAVRAAWQAGYERRPLPRAAAALNAALTASLFD
jgi:hypothetical protein